jgi:hypothetical protein
MDAQTKMIDVTTGMMEEGARFMGLISGGWNWRGGASVFSLLSHFMGIFQY